MFTASKLLSFATQPLAWVVLLFAVALLCVPRKRALGLRLGWVSLGLLLLLGWQPLPDVLLRALEARWTTAPVPARRGRSIHWSIACGAEGLRCMNGPVCSPTAWPGARDARSSPPERGLRVVSIEVAEAAR